MTLLLEQSNNHVILMSHTAWNVCMIFNVALHFLKTETKHSASRKKHIVTQPPLLLNWLPSYLFLKQVLVPSQKRWTLVSTLIHFFIMYCIIIIVPTVFIVYIHTYAHTQTQL